MKEDTAFLERRNSCGTVKSDRQSSIDVVEKCLDRVILLASDGLDSICLLLRCKLADCACRKFQGCHVDKARKLNDRWNHDVCCWFHSEHWEMLDECPSVVVKNNSISSGVTFAEG